MDSESDPSLALLSIHPKYATLIFNGTKRVEFRKKTFGRAVKTVVVYATSPVSRIVGYFTVKEIFRESPSRVWARFEAYGGISKSEFDEYYRGTDTAVAILIEEATPLTRPMELQSEEVKQMF